MRLLKHKTGESILKKKKFSLITSLYLLHFTEAGQLKTDESLSNLGFHISASSNNEQAADNFFLYYFFSSSQIKKPQELMITE